MGEFTKEELKEIIEKVRCSSVLNEFLEKGDESSNSYVDGWNNAISELEFEIFGEI